MDMQKETIFSEVETANSKQLAVLKANFPQCFDKNGAFIQEKLLEIVKSSDVELSKESYSLNWLGKSYARLLANLPPKTLLTEDKDHNQRAENKNSQNLLIKGDNLEVLKHMTNAYAEKVKMIYIDPPYNTGKDGFAYNDDRKFTPEQLSALAGIDLDEATRILDFTVKGSSSHSAWLTFIYPRLYIARELLREDGVIFISIDENELNQLKTICDEIFGEANFIENIVWNKRIPKNDKGIGNIHEYILAYAKTNEISKEFLMRKDGIDDVYQFIEKLKKEKVPLDRAEQQLKKFYSSNGYDRGITLYNGLNEDYRPWGKINMSWPNADSFGPTYEVLHPLTNNPVKIPDRGWRWKEETFNEIAKRIDGKYTDIKKLHDGSTICGGIWFASTEKTQPSSVKFLDEVEEFLLRSIISTKSDGGVEVENLFGGKGYFSYPKPTSLIKTLFGSVKTEDKDIFLDFFAGSGTTAHGILELNIEDNKKRNFICVQLDEETDKKKQAYKEGYRSIFDITKDRIIKAGEKLKKENPDYNGELGFKTFETVNDFRTKDESKLTLSNHTFFDDVVLTPEQYDTLLTTWCLYDGSLLTTPIEDVDLNGYKAHLCDDRLYLIAPNFTSEALKALLQKLDSDKDFAPNKVVFYGSNFESAKQMELNEALKSYANKKSIDLDLVVRN
ncbi:site-specific DNA-methyltransferase [Enterobacter cloacae complex sp. 2025EL-00025]|uniref:site-specific DNA-methyltransferase n=1 Tax=Enterobacter cloacae complex sp. 2025EL-00025 TaxID=3414994 RepID=UPI00130B65F3|nr:site-specific DNA-methyltransferase [Salmonella enterica]ECT9048467.1 site-specific DNA-methyltransferase [Salmonella enterica subsp. enterica serovar Oranienburg]EGP1114860.1 site-specific DNA-methyltransferase [Salmonella enterica subsp. enterica serovar Infantis]EKS8451498.1 site-specific DNA-methyltransferase [Salmonella enterica subsp. enterica serovar Cerro]EJV5632798.1 site-specific DNA-methyltransferase [Salmonella enterica]